MPIQNALDAMHVPQDAGEYEEDLVKILKRIPDGWGRWISCDKGWYPLITELDKALVELDPNYTIHQVKEKFGGLRYYASSTSSVAHDLIDEAERKSYTICELCGAPAQLMKTNSKYPWYKTVCSACAGDKYVAAVQTNS